MTFACLNSYYRLNRPALIIWAAILKRLPASRLALVGAPEGKARQELKEQMEALGGAPRRLELFGFLDYANYLRLIRLTDVALGPFPYNGAMSMLDCLWQGTPVIAMRGGATFRSRMTMSIYDAIGLREFIADDDAGYIEATVSLALKTQSSSRH